MSDKPIAAAGISEAVRNAVELAAADLGHHNFVGSPSANSWHTVGIVMTDQAKAETFAKSVTAHDGVKRMPTVIKLDAHKFIAGFVDPEALHGSTR